MADIDDLLNFINDDSKKAPGKKKNKKKKGGNEGEKKEGENEIEEKKEETKTEDKKEETKTEDKKEENEKEGETGNTEGGENKKKKKNHHKKKKKEEGPKENPYRSLFDWKDTEITNKRAQDNSLFRKIGNWEEKEWNQT